MSRKLFAGTTGWMQPILVGNSSTNAGLPSLAYNTSGLVGEYRRAGQSTWTPIALVAGTPGTYLSGGWAADGNLAGAYEVGIPNAAIAAGAPWVNVRYYGAADMSPVELYFELDAVNYQSASGFIAGVGGAAPPANWSDTVISSGGLVSATVAGYASGQSPANSVLATPAQKLATDASGNALISMAQVVPASNTAQTTGDALNAARAQGFGKWVLDTDSDPPTLTLYAGDGATVVRTFNLDSATAPTYRE